VDCIGDLIPQTMESERALQTAARCFLSLLRDVQTAAAGRSRPTHSSTSRLEIELLDPTSRQAHGDQSDSESRPLLPVEAPSPAAGKRPHTLASMLR
jgi:hypothetical protein